MPEAPKLSSAVLQNSEASIVKGKKKKRRKETLKIAIEFILGMRLTEFRIWAAQGYGIKPPPFQRCCCGSHKTQSTDRDKLMQKNLTLAGFYRVFLLLPPVSAAEALSLGAAAAVGAARAASAGAATPGAPGAHRPPPLSGLQGAAAPVVLHKLPYVSLLRLSSMLSAKETR